MEAISKNTKYCISTLTAAGSETKDVLKMVSKYFILIINHESVKGVNEVSSHCQLIIFKLLSSHSNCYTLPAPPLGYPILKLIG